VNAHEKSIQLYLTESGKCPFEKWFDGLRDIQAQQRILARIARLRSGNVGDWKAIGEGVFELRIDSGPGYRIYFGFEGNTIVILLIGGTKDSQDKDIKKAKDYWHDYEESEKSKDF
jgi:putative addiction module killer protein